VVRFGESDELDAIAALQTDGFYEPVMGARSGLTAVDGPLRAYFESDVASTLKKKYAYAKLGRFAPLVMEDENGALIGVIEVSVQRDSEVMRAMGTIEGLTVTDEYAYLSCMCVESTRRRSGIATTLIRAGESIAKEWGFNLTMLHVYENNRGAMEAYERNGFATLDRPWRTPVDVVKNQQKILMAKRI
jgi:ribosomal protein S18 acetylase RimI-like enzyme